MGEPIRRNPTGTSYGLRTVHKWYSAVALRKSKRTPHLRRIAGEVKVEARGIEPFENSKGNTAKSGQRGAESGAVSLDPDLAMVVERWGSLPDAVRTCIVALVRAALAGGS